MTLTITTFIKKIPNYHTAPHCKICLYFLYYLQIEKNLKISPQKKLQNVMMMH